MTTCMTFEGNATDTKSDSPNGKYCFFIKLHNTGLKVYRSERVRNQSFDNQSYLYNHGLAPRTYFKTEIKFADHPGHAYYAFETELAEVFGERSDYDSPEEYLSAESLFDDASSELQERIEEHNCNEDADITWSDDHSGNVGFIGGEPVMVDCADYLFDGGRLA